MMDEVREDAERRATIVATAYRNDGVMQDALKQDIVERVDSSTDVPVEDLGEAVAYCLRRAWSTGIDPALEPGFHIRVTFE